MPCASEGRGVEAKSVTGRDNVLRPCEVGTRMVIIKPLLPRECKVSQVAWAAAQPARRNLSGVCLMSSTLIYVRVTC